MTKFLIALLLLAGGLYSCRNGADTANKMDEDDEYESSAELVLKNLKQGDFEIKVIDNCEYLIYTDDFQSTQQGYGFMAHKGNCKNPIHCYNSIKPDSTITN